MSKPKAPHHEDVEFAGIAASATEFVAFLFGGRGARYRETAGSFAEAVEAGLALKAAHPEVGSRRPIVYAIGPRRQSIDVDRTIATLAGFDEAAIERLFA